ELIAGERRWRAFQFLKIRKIPARVIKASDASSAALALIENLQREGLNPIEEALGYSSLIRDFDLTQEAAAERVGKGRATVANALRLLTLDTKLQAYIARGMLSIGHAKVLLGLPEAAHRELLAQRIIENSISVREAEREVKRIKEGKSARKAQEAGGANSAENTAILNLERTLTSELNTNVSVKHSAKKGKLIIEYRGNDDLQRILDRMGVSVG
ncbi:MAG: ParB/RepB/Spo0J family partition protein, partial [Verrucomicrobiota bacterium]